MSHFDVFIDAAPIVTVDIDGVLADFDGEVKSRLKERHSNIPILETRENFYISDDYPEHRLKVRAISDEEGFFESLPLVKNALEGWQRLIDLGVHPLICSAPIQSNPFSKVEKLNWLQQHFVPVFGEWVVDQAIITSDKHLFHATALIDDRPQMKNAEMATWKHIIFDQPYNRDILNQPRLHGWLDEALPEILKDIINN